MHSSAPGITLIEILVSVALGLLVMGMISMAGFSYVGGFQYIREQETLVGVLQKARSRAMNNVGGQPYGVHIEGSPSTITFFKGSTWISAAPTNEAYPLSKSTVTPSGTNVVFTQLTGATTPVTLTIDDGVRTNPVNINAEGRIDW